MSVISSRAHHLFEKIIFRKDLPVELIAPATEQGPMIPYAMYVSTMAPSWIVPRLNQHIVKCRESGLFDQWSEEVLEQVNRVDLPFRGRWSSFSTDDPPKYQQIKLEEMIALLCIGLLGHSLATIVCLVQRFYSSLFHHPPTFSEWYSTRVSCSLPPRKIPRVIVTKPIKSSHQIPHRFTYKLQTKNESARRCTPFLEYDRNFVRVHTSHTKDWRPNVKHRIIQ